MSQQAKLTDKQRAFVEAYLANGRNGAAAYRAAYDPKAAPTRAAEQASILLRNPKIAPLVAAAEARAAGATERVIERYAISRARIMAELAAIGFSSMGDYMRAATDGDPVLNFKDLMPEQKAALAEVTVDSFQDGRGEDTREVKRVRFKLHDKKGALVELARMNGWLTPPVDPNSLDGKVGLLQLILDSMKPRQEPIA